MHRKPTSSGAGHPRVIPANEYVRMRWRNGAGWTRAILQAGRTGADTGTDAPDWDWRLSIAEIEQPGPFSRFPGVERELVLLQGDGLALHFDGNACSEEALTAVVDAACRLPQLTALTAGFGRATSLRNALHFCRCEGGRKIVSDSPASKSSVSDDYVH